MYKNILVINLMHIGDLMLVTPILTTLRANYPKARLTLLADKKLRDLVELNGNLDECMLIDKKGKDDGMLAMAGVISKVRAKNFDLVINLHRNERASSIAAFSGAKKIVGYSKPGFAWMFTQVLPNKKATMHQIHSHFEVLQKAVGIRRIVDRGLEMWVPPKGEDEAQKLWRENFFPGDKVIAFNIGASWLTKRWIDSYFAECADDFIRRGYKIIFLGSADDKKIVEKTTELMKSPPSGYHIFTGKLTLGALAAVLKRCVLFVTTDSGPMHVGVAMHVPIVTMFGASPVPGFYPYDSRDILIKTPVKCHPCGDHECKKSGKEHLSCMKLIPPSVVLKYSYELLDKYEKKVGNMPLPSDFKCRVISL